MHLQVNNVSSMGFLADFDKIEPYWLLKAIYYSTFSLSLMIEQEKNHFLNFFIYHVASAPSKYGLDLYILHYYSKEQLKNQDNLYLSGICVQDF